jgi:hypothetical protein
MLSASGRAFATGAVFGSQAVVVLRAGRAVSGQSVGIGKEGGSHR